jgi:hypothetical protein
VIREQLVSRLGITSATFEFQLAAKVITKQQQRIGTPCRKYRRLAVCGVLSEQVNRESPKK